MRSVVEQWKERARRPRVAMATLVVASVLGGCATGYTASSAPGTYVGTRGGPMSVHVDLSSRQLSVSRGGGVVATYPVAVGQDAYPTPTGTFSVSKIVWNPDWVPPNSAWAAEKEPQEPGAAANPMKVVKIFFQEPDFYIHGTASSASLGTAASHGCLRMSPADASALARMLMDAGGSPRDESWFAHVMANKDDKQTVILDHAVPITISN